MPQKARRWQRGASQRAWLWDRIRMNPLTIIGLAMIIIGMGLLVILWPTKPFDIKDSRFVKGEAEYDT